MSKLSSRIHAAVVIGTACLWVACARDHATGPTPAVAATPTPPPPVVIKEGSFGIPTAGSGRFTAFKTSQTGVLQIGLDWTATGKETTIDAVVIERSYEGACAPSCDAEDFCPAECRTEIERWGDLAQRPATLKTKSSLKPSNYEFLVSYYDPLDYTLPWRPDAPPRVSVSYQLVLLPSASASAGRSARE